MVLKFKFPKEKAVHHVLSLMLALALFFTIRPYPVWEHEITWGHLSVVLISTVYIAVFTLGLYRKVIDTFSLSFLFFFVLLLISTEIPFRPYDSAMSLGTLIITLAPAIMFLAKEQLARTTYHYIYYIFVFICIASLLNYVLYSIGVISPLKRVFLDKATFYTSGFDYYTLAPVLAGQYIDIGLHIYRNNGWFYEPGHFACYLAFVLALQEKPFEGLANRIIVLTMLSTLSGVAFLFLTLFYAFHSLKNLSLKLLFFVIAFLVFVFALVEVNAEMSYLMDKYVFTKFAGGDTLDNRRNFYGPGVLELPRDKLLFGYGGKYIGTNNWQVSDFTNHIYSYGLPAFLFFVASVFAFLVMSIKKGWSALTLLLIVFLLVYAHRYFIAFRTFAMVFFCFAYALSISREQEDLK